jgi:hypothetical protein
LILRRVPGTLPRVLHSKRGWWIVPDGIICQACGIEAPARAVDFRQNIGMLVMRTHKCVKGRLCKKCVHKYFWKTTTTTLFLGPWGYISLFIAPIFIINNIVRYVGALGMPPVPPGASVPVLDDAAIKRISPHYPALVDKLNLKQPLEQAVTDIARKAGVTPGQVLKFAVETSRQNRPPASTGGFPVITPVAKPQQVLPADAVEDSKDADVSEAMNTEHAQPNPTEPPLLDI